MQVLIQNFVWAAIKRWRIGIIFVQAIRAWNTVKTVAKDKNPATITALSVVEKWDNIADRKVALLYSQGTEQQHQLLLN